MGLSEAASSDRKKPGQLVGFTEVLKSSALLQDVRHIVLSPDPRF